MSNMTIQSERSKQRAEKNKQFAGLDSHATKYGFGFFVKLILMAIVNALGIYVVAMAWQVDSKVLAIGMVVLILVVDWVYFSKRTLALKYLTPGLIFLIVFQAFTILYTGYIAFTNYGHQHTLTKGDAIESILLQNNTKRVPNSPEYPMALVLKDGEVGLAIIDGDVVKVGSANDPLSEVNAEVDGTTIKSVDGWDMLPASQISQYQSDILALRVPVSDDAAEGAFGTQTGQRAYLYTSSMKYDADADTMTNTDTGVVYKANGKTGFFEADDGDKLGVGWRVTVGFKNFLDGFTDSRYQQPFVKVFIWNVVFAFLSVITTFLLGMFLAIVMNDERMKGRKLYRTVMLVPYAFPSFMTAFLFAGMMNEKYGFFNTVLLGGAEIPWLTDPTMAKVSVLLVNLWMGFPYMFLIVTGALQSIPGELTEAAKIDGASTAQVWRNVTLPQLMISLTPLLISSFAFNFNNFNLIYMLNEGGPRMADASVPVGHTDILISMVYKIAGLTGEATPNYGLAAAMSLIIFVIVGGVSLYSFRKSKSMEGLS